MSVRGLALVASALIGMLLGVASVMFNPDGRSVLASSSKSLEPAPGVSSSANANLPAQEELIGAALGALMGDLDQQDLARLGEVLGHLDSAQIAELLERLERGKDRATEYRLAWLFSWWMKRDPEAATEWLQPKLTALSQDGPLGMWFEMSAKGKLILAWAKADPKRAVEYAREHARTGLAAQLLRTAALEWPEKDDRACLAALLDFPSGAARSGALELLAWDWAKRDPAAAFTAAQSMPGEDERMKSTVAVLRAWGQDDASAALEHYKAAAVKDLSLLGEILGNVALSDPARAVAFVEALDPLGLVKCGPHIVEKWAERDPAAALGWALERGVPISASAKSERAYHHDSFARSFYSSGQVVRPLAKALEKEPEATIAWLRSLPPGAERERLYELATVAAKNVDDAIALFANLPPEAASRTAYAVAEKFRLDLEKGQQWAASLPSGSGRLQAWAALGGIANKPLDLPPGPDRDAMLSGLARSNSRLNDPVYALNDVIQISDPVLRREVFNEIMEAATRFDSRAKEVRAWMEKSELPEDWKRRWRAPVAGDARP